MPTIEGLSYGGNFIQVGNNFPKDIGGAYNTKLFSNDKKSQNP